jgi:hypothetical protein
VRALRRHHLAYQFTLLPAGVVDTVAVGFRCRRLLRLGWNLDLARRGALDGLVVKRLFAVKKSVGHRWGGGGG